MGKSTLKQEKITHNINLTLLIISAAIVVVLVIGTIIGFARSSNAPPLMTLGSSRPRTAKLPAQESAAAAADDIRVFAGLGRLRIPLSNSTTLLLSVTFPYSANDTPFTEELAAKLGELKAIASEYFSALPEANIIQIDEEAAKQEILRRFNNTLRLGRIHTLYFGDMLVID